MPRTAKIAVLLVSIGLLAAVGWWRIYSEPVAVVRRPRAVMGTSSMLVAVVPRYRRAAAEEALHDAESVLRSLEAKLSTWITASEVSLFNRADRDQNVQLSHDTAEVLRAARDTFQTTEGTFDITCRPVIELWRKMGKEDRLPTAEEIAAARAASHWDLIRLAGDQAAKRRSSCRVDLGGIGKGYAIDAAIAALGRAGIADGLVDVGGDQRLIGDGPRRLGWSVGIEDPFAPGVRFTFEVRATAICTSGDYARIIEIDGRRYSHIIDPRHGRPTDAGVASVTVFAPTAVQADIWATALSVLGPDGLDELPDGVDALMILGPANRPRTIASANLPRRLRGPLPAGVEIASSDR